MIINVLLKYHSRWKTENCMAAVTILLKLKIDQNNFLENATKNANGQTH